MLIVIVAKKHKIVDDGILANTYFTHYRCLISAVISISVFRNIAIIRTNNIAEKQNEIHEGAPMRSRTHRERIMLGLASDSSPTTSGVKHQGQVHTIY